MAPGCGNPAERPRRVAGVVADDGGQMVLLVMSLLLVMCALGAYVLDVADRVHARTVEQEAADAAAYTAAAETARGLNYISNGNIAVLELTAYIAAIDAFGETAARTRDFLDGESIALDLAMVAAIAVSVVTLGAGSETIDAVQAGMDVVNAQLEYLDVLDGIYDVLKGVREVLVLVRKAISILDEMVAYAISAPPKLDLSFFHARTGFDLVPFGEGAKAARDVDPNCVALEVPPIALPLQLEKMQHYEEVGRPELEKFKLVGELMFLPTANVGSVVAKALDLAKGLGFPVDAPSFLPDYSASIERFYKEEVEGDEIHVVVLEKEGDEVDQAFADGGFRRTWNALADAPRPLLASLFGRAGKRRVGAVAESLTFNPDRWDLVTPRWEAALVPVTRLPLTSDPAELVLGKYAMHH